MAARWAPATTSLKNSCASSLYWRMSEILALRLGLKIGSLRMLDKIGFFVIFALIMALLKHWKFVVQLKGMAHPFHFLSCV